MKPEIHFLEVAVQRNRQAAYIEKEKANELANVSAISFGLNPKLMIAK